MSKTDTIERTARSSIRRRVLPDGTIVPLPSPPPLAAMTEAEIHAAAMADPDAQPTAETAPRRAVPRTKTLRRALDMTQEEFAARFHIPIGTLRDWEQGRTEPDQTARAYLSAIAGDAGAVERALRAMPELPVQPKSAAVSW